MNETDKIVNEIISGVNVVRNLPDARLGLRNAAESIEEKLFAAMRAYDENVRNIANQFKCTVWAHVESNWNESEIKP